MSNVSELLKAEREKLALRAEAESLLDAGEYKRALAMKPRLDAAREKAARLAAMLPGSPYTRDDIDLAEPESLPELVACHLAGKKVTIAWDADLEPGIGGLCHVVGESARISISGELTTIEGRFATLLHEIAHAHYGDKGRDSGQEARAVAQARQWDEYADSHKFSYGTPREPEHVRKLRGLLSWNQ